MASGPRKTPRPTVSIVELMTLVYAMAMVNWLIVPFRSKIATSGFTALSWGQISAIFVLNGLVVGSALIHFLMRWRLKVDYLRNGIDEPSPLSRTHPVLKWQPLLLGVSLTCFVLGVKLAEGGPRQDYRPSNTLLGLSSVMSVVVFAIAFRASAAEAKKRAAAAIVASSSRPSQAP